MDLSRLFRFAIDHCLEIIIGFNENGIITYANPSAERQMQFHEGLCGHHIRDIYPIDFWMDDNSLHPKVLFENNSLVDRMAYRKNKTCFPTRGSVYCFDETEREKQYIFIAHNMSNESFLEKKANQAGQVAEEAHKVKSEFVANVTHELRTPVNGILGIARELLSMEDDKEKSKRLMLIEHGCGNMNALINSILDFSKLEAGKFTLEPREFNFREMIEYIKDTHGNRITEKGLEFTISVSRNVPACVIGDKLRIEQILNNLLSNAYKFTDAGSIHLEIIKTTQTDNRVELFFMVLDTGCGISKEQQEKLFQSFVQADASISRRYGGTGLGLYISKQLSELMGGSIHVESEEGRGSNFSFSIWVEIPRTDANQENQNGTETQNQSLIIKLQNVSNPQVSQQIWHYNTAENRQEVQKKMSKLALSVEMDNWSKAEMFAENVKKLLEEAPREVKSAALRLKMSVQKGDYEKTMAAYEALQTMLMDSGGN